MKLGMPTLIELDTLEENAILCNGLGLDFVEINMNLPQYQTPNLSAENLNHLQSKYGLFFTFHLAEDIDIAHFNKKVRAVFCEVVLDTIDLMKKVGSTKLNMHMNTGVYFTLPSEKIYLYEKFMDQYVSNVVSFRSKVEEQIGVSKIEISIENTGAFNNEFLVSAADALLESKVFSLTWDIGHEYSNGNVDKKFLSERSEKISHMHIHDAIGYKDHMELYTGELDVDRYVDFVRINKMTAVIETKTKLALEQSVSGLNKRLRTNGGIKSGL